MPCAPILPVPCRPLQKPLGAYMFFCADKRAGLKKEFPDLKVSYGTLHGLVA